MKQNRSIDFLVKAAKELGAEKTPILLGDIITKTQEIMKDKSSSKDSLAASLNFHTVNMQSRFPEPKNPKKRASWMLEPYFVRAKERMYRLLNEEEKMNIKITIDRDLDIVFSSEYSIEELNTSVDKIKKNYWFIFVNTEYSKIVELKISENDIALCDKAYNDPENWNVLGNLGNLIDNYDSFFEHYKGVYPEMDTRSQSQKAKELWNFLTTRIGDLVVVSDKTVEIIGVGQVNGAYIYDENMEKFKHLKPINWISRRKVKLPNDFRDFINITQTIQSITKEEFEKLVGQKKIDLQKKVYTILELLNNKKQIIFYGPPGTGKTYNTKKITIDFLKKE